MTRKHIFRLLCSLLLAAATAQAAMPGGLVSENGMFTVRYESQLTPIVINQMHSWTLYVNDADGQPVTGATIAVTGGMPAHNHGLATAPSVTEQGGGAYQLQGLRFHMMGYWEVTLEISQGGTRDKVVIQLDL